MTATVSAVLMAVALLEGTLGGLTKPLLAVLALLGVGTEAIASMALFRVKEGRLLENWLTARAREAETKRLSYFTWLVEVRWPDRHPARLTQVGILSPLSAGSADCLLPDPEVGPPPLG